MKRLGAALLLALAASAPSAPAAAAETDLWFGAGDARTRVRVAVQWEGRPAEQAWEAFLRTAFDFFDRDGDEFLSKAEAARVFPPLSGEDGAPLTFARLDADGDGRASPAEFQTYARRNGFGPQVVEIVPPSGEMIRAGAALFRAMDDDADGGLSAEELRKAAVVLRRLDENEDESLSLAEASGSRYAPKSVSAPVAEVAIAKGEGTADVLLEFRLGEGAPQVAASALARGVSLEGEAGGVQNALRLSFGEGGLIAGSDDGGRAKALKAALGFYRAQIREAAGDADSVLRKRLEDDPAFRSAAAFAEAADRDSDGRLTLSEGAAFLKMVGDGARCQTRITVVVYGPNLFALLDRDGDGRLSLSELNAAGSTGASRRRFAVMVAQGTARTSFGPLVLPAPSLAKPPPRPAAAASDAPLWFISADRNDDGLVSPREFPGSAELFQRLDADQDGVVSPRESRTPPAP